MKKINVKDFLDNSGITKEDVELYYSDHTLAECAEFFNVNRKMMARILIYYDIKLRTKSEVNAMRNARKLNAKLEPLISRISREKLESIYYIMNIDDCLAELNITSYTDLKQLLDFYKIERKTYQDREVTRQHTLKKLYNVTNNFQRDEVIEKISIIAKNRSDEEKLRINNKIKSTKLERYGDENYNNSEQAAQTIIEKYGSIENINKIKKEKSIITNNERYGADWFMQTDQYKEEYKETCNKKYNCDFFCQSEHYIKTSRKSYYYDDIYFDSSWELALWLYAKNNNKQIERHPLRLEYFEGNIKHYYFPDFLYDGKLIEIKGDHMLDLDGNLIDAYNSGISSELLKAKQECMINNNVIIWSSKDIKFALNWCKENKIKLNDYKK